MRYWASSSPFVSVGFLQRSGKRLPFLRITVGTTLQVEEEGGEDPKPSPETRLSPISSAPAQSGSKSRPGRQGRWAGASGWGGGQQEWSRLAAGTPRPTHSGDRKQAQVRLDWSPQWKTSFWAKRGPGHGSGWGRTAASFPVVCLGFSAPPTHKGEFIPPPCGRTPDALWQDQYGQTRGFQQSGGPAKYPSVLDRSFSRDQPGSLGPHKPGLVLLRGPRSSLGSLHPPKGLSNLD